MEDPGTKLRRIRERLGLTIRDVEDASRRIADRYNNDEFVIVISRLSDIENRSAVPTVYRLYSLCVIYRLEPSELLEWYGVRLSALAADSAGIAIGRTHPLTFAADGRSEVQVPLTLDPGLDVRKTTYLSRLIQRWGRLPLALLANLELKNHLYAFVGTDDWSMYPILYPGSLVLIDETRRRIAPNGWVSEFDRPIYFLEHRDGYLCGWCTLADGRLIVHPHPSSASPARVFHYEGDVDVLGQVVGVAMRLDLGGRRRGR